MRKLYVSPANFKLKLKSVLAVVLESLYCEICESNLRTLATLGCVTRAMWSIIFFTFQI